MNRTTLGYLAIGVVLLMMVVLLVGGGGLPSETRALVEAELTNFSQAQRQFESIEQDVRQALEAEPKLFAIRAYDVRWPEQLENAEAQLAGAAEKIPTIKELREQNEPDDQGKLEQLTQDVAATRVAVLAEAEQMRAEAQRWLNLKRNLPQVLEQMERNYRVVQGVSLAETRAKVEQAQQDWPTKRDDLAQRLDALEDNKATAETMWNQTADLRAAAENDNLAEVDFGLLATASRTLDQLASGYERNVAELADLTEQLYVAWDRILADMEIREGEVVTFHHQYKTVRTQVPPGAGAAPAADDPNTPADNPDAPPPQVDTSENWETVTEAKYKQMEKNLGMVVAHKSAGMYDHEATDTIQPPGYAYIAPPEQGRNRYGYWENRGGSSFWVFYGQYALMRDLLWGPSWRNYDVTPRGYRNYRDYRSAGRTYYGQTPAGKPRYGSTGTLTRQSYSNAKYVRTDGFKRSRYVQSGGTYRGSRFERSSRGYSSGRGSASRGRSGSRFGFGK